MSFIELRINRDQKRKLGINGSLLLLTLIVCCHFLWWVIIWPRPSFGLFYGPPKNTIKLPNWPLFNFQFSFPSIYSFSRSYLPPQSPPHPTATLITSITDFLSCPASGFVTEPPLRLAPSRPTSVTSALHHHDVICTHMRPPLRLNYRRHLCWMHRQLPSRFHHSCRENHCMQLVTNLRSLLLVVLPDFDLCFYFYFFSEKKKKILVNLNSYWLSLIFLWILLVLFLLKWI